MIVSVSAYYEFYLNKQVVLQMRGSYGKELLASFLNKKTEINSCRAKWLKYWAKYYHYLEIKRRIQIPEDTKSCGETERDEREFRICHHHTAEEKKDRKTVMLPQMDNGVMEKCSIGLKYMVPSATGVSNLSLGPESRGNAVERGHLALLERLDKQRVQVKG